MKKNYVTPEMEDFKYEVPSLYGTEEQSGVDGGNTHDEGGDPNVNL